MSDDNDLKIFSNFIFIFLAVFFKSAIDLIYANVFPSSGLAIEPIGIYKIALLLTTLLYIIDDSIESQLINLRHPYRSRWRFFLDFIILNLLFISLKFEDGLSRFYLLSLSFSFFFSVVWAKSLFNEVTIESPDRGAASRAASRNIELTHLLAAIVFLLLFLFCYWSKWSKKPLCTEEIISYGLVWLIVWYIIYDFGKYLLKDIEGIMLYSIIISGIIIILKAIWNIHIYIFNKIRNIFRFVIMIFDSLKNCYKKYCDRD
jgi:hypothetical protein